MFNALKCVTLRNKKLLFMVFQNSTRDYVCETILKRQFQTVAIQCPDSLLQHVPEIVHQFEDSVNRIINLKEEGSQCTKKPLFVILADTASGSSCCVDIVAAKHYSAGMLPLINVLDIFIKIYFSFFKQIVLFISDLLV
jgi:diphthamide biosynthesis enzyme Dph1/Dph2-like protein